MKDSDTAHSPKISKGFFWAWLILLMSVATYLRVHGASEYHYFQDEAMYYNIAKGRTFLETLQFSLIEIHPPLLYLLLHYWIMLSDTPSFVRGLSLLFGLATIPLYYAIGKKLNGQLTGMIAATLVAFSLGLIEQSYLARQYSLLVFLLSVCFYSYICWHNKQSVTTLCIYALFGLLTCITHFAGIFSIFCMASTETVYMAIRKIDRHQQVKWACVNVLIGAVWLGIFYLWQPAFKDWYPSVSHLTPLYAVAIRALLSLQDAYLVFPCAAVALLWVFLLPLTAYYSIHKCTYFLVIPWVAIGLDMILKAGFIYPGFGREELWLTPFIITIVAWPLAECGYLLPERYLKNLSWQYATVCVAFIAGIWMYNPEVRFSQRGEYQLTENQWQALRNYVDSLGADHLVFAEHGESFLLMPYDDNSYVSISKNSDESPSSTVVVPLGKTHLMFRKFYMHYDHENFIRMMKEAKQNGTLDGINALVFTITSSSRTAARSLLSCKALDKKIVFPPMNPEHPFASDNLFYPVILLEVSKKALFEQAIAESGKAHYCLQGKEN